MALYMLTHKQISTAKDTDKQTALHDGGGLYFTIHKARRSWVFMYRVSKTQQRRMGLGSFPEISLARARELAEDARKLRANGVDPLDAREAAEQEAAKTAEKANTVRTLAEQWASKDLVTRKDGGQNALRTLEKDAFGIIGNMSPEEVRAVHIVEVIDAIKARGVTRTTSVVFELLRQMFRWATVRELIPKDLLISVQN